MKFSLLYLLAYRINMRRVIPPQELLAEKEDIMAVVNLLMNLKNYVAIDGEKYLKLIIT
jgi:hypothetical protein